MHTLPIYRRVFQISIQDVLSYRLDFALHTIKYIIMIVMMGVVWSSIAEVSTASGTGAITQSPAQIMQYFVWTALLYTLSNFHLNYIEEDIRTGKLALQMLKPFRPFLYYFSFEAGQVATETVLKALVMLPLALWMGVQMSGSMAGLPPLSALLIVALYVPVIYSFAFAQFTLISGLSFWIVRASAIRWALIMVFRFLSGALVPISFLPGLYQEVLAWLPWQYLIFTPIQLLQGDIGWQMGLQGLGILLCWTLLAHLGRWLIWRQGYRSFESVGI